MNSKLLGYVFTLIGSIVSVSCEAQDSIHQPVKTGADQIETYIESLQDKRVGLLVNHTSYIENVHLLDTLTSRGILIETIFAPEHGFRGNHANGEKVNNEIDEKTQTPVISLYGKNKKPTIEQLANIDVVIYDIQDVGARFYTYISTMHYMMEACALSGTSMIILDRPNPHGSYMDGPVLDPDFQSFVGVHPIPIVYGMTPGELAMMIKGEQWINEADRLELTIVPIVNWTHQSGYELPISPSPNLPNQQSILLYPSLCLFEGTNVSIGRGTDAPFQMVGHPAYKSAEYSFTPVSIEGASKSPKHENNICRGIDLRETKPMSAIDLSYLIHFYNSSEDKSTFFNDFFSKLVGTNQLQAQIERGLSEAEIKETWQPELLKFKQLRRKHLLYKE